MSFRLGLIAVAALLSLAACETGKGNKVDGKGEGGGPVAVKMLTDVDYDNVMRAAQVPADAFQEERNYTAILARPDVTDDQKIRTQYMRAVIRGTTASNLNGSIEDYAAVVAKIQDTHRLYKPATDNLAYGQRQKQYVEQRIAKGPTGQPRGDYFDDLLFIGRHQDAAAFAKSGQVQLTSLQTEKLAKLGYLCEGAGYSGPSYRWGSSNTAQHVVYWCDTKKP